MQVSATYCVTFQTVLFVVYSMLYYVDSSSNSSSGNCSSSSSSSKLVIVVLVTVMLIVIHQRADKEQKLRPSLPVLVDFVVESCMGMGTTVVLR